MKIYIISLVVFLNMACQAGGRHLASEDSLHAVNGASSINTCIGEYERITNKAIGNEIDRAFVLANKNKYEVIFSKGSTGIFEKRDERYAAFLWCGLVLSDVPMIYYLSDGLGDPLIDIDGISQISDEDTRDAWDIVFVKKSGEFEFHQKKLYNPDSYQF
ncbi:hypothetical protein [Marinagarivorans algicola]|uniref:hypothetical protein n=1 Tax=Marinagarivorans algicola TaxID=1513270 RepID=UPI0006B4B9B4|nr:hypothetical protein [Marinagarivorans algicola]